MNITDVTMNTWRQRGRCLWGGWKSEHHHRVLRRGWRVRISSRKQKTLEDTQTPETRLLVDLSQTSSICHDLEEEPHIIGQRTGWFQRLDPQFKKLDPERAVRSREEESGGGCRAGPAGWRWRRGWRWSEAGRNTASPDDTWTELQGETGDNKTGDLKSSNQL